MKRRIVFYFAALLFIIVNSNIALRAAQPQMAVLLYHHLLPAADIEAYKDNGLVVTQESFASQMEYLYKNGYHTVTSGELRSFLYDKKPFPPKSVMITFDDGYMSNYMFAYPILRQYGFHAVIFAITGSVQTMDQDYHRDKLDMLSWMQVAASSDVFEYGSHTDALHNIREIETGFVSASLTEAQADLQFSLKRVSGNKIFSYPSGQYNAQLVDMIRNNGVKLAFTVNEGYVNAGSNPLLLNRVTVYTDFDLGTFGSVAACKHVFQ